MVVGGALAYILPMTLQRAGTSLLLPIAGVFIGLTFAWGGNAQALLQSDELARLSSFRDGGYEEYLYTYQSAVLLILVTLCCWALAGLGILDKVWPTSAEPLQYKTLAGVLFFLSSITVRECWHVVMGSQAMLLARFEIRKHDQNHGNDS